jgi:anti-sigma-K factor RskA
MMRDHTHIEELLAIRSLGGLEQPDEAELEREMASHGPDCEECRRLEIEFGEAAGRLAFALDPAPVSEHLADETFERAFGGSAVRTKDERAPTRRRGWLRPLVGVAAAIVLFAGGIVVGAAVNGGNEQASEKTVLTFQSETEPGTLTAAFTPGQPGVYMVGTGLPVLPQGKAYELWLFEGETPTSAMCAVPSADGSVFGFSNASLQDVGLMAVTVESNSCPSAPTTEPVFTAEVTA